MSDIRDPAHVDAWQALRRLTPARIALGHAGTSLPTSAQLQFQLAHAQARDAVHQPLETQPLCELLQQRGQTCLLLHSAAADRHVYLQRPDLGRRLDDASVELLRGHVALQGGDVDLALVAADGLSALAVQRHAAPMLERVATLAADEGWSLAPVTLVRQARVAIGDEIGGLLRARMVVVLIGERPGLSSPDSLGIYLTHAPRVGRSDAERNCLSNIRSEGMGYAQATHTLRYLLREAFRRGLSGVALKDETDAAPQALDGADAPRGNFLLPGQ